MNEDPDSNRRTHLVMVWTTLLWLFGTVAYAYT
jgi:hypothetical protein